ncbi:hypothetical protein [Xylophilus sp. Leaf220]|uniref:hypothetical protein n=1 Tax=Xylophilus sp. Leaf220 TaxID=1735686 RepID=UPI0006F3E69F|nr:hypothetical protein [Xylophilus sp. Leaf220]KQM72962.1 hypothetical protein ASE76_19480 [Xylophilus sp. Leaf220]
MLHDERRGTDEAYISATSATNLRVEADRRGDADVLIAAGWSMVQLGNALLRLHSEFDAVGRRRVTTAADFVAGVPAQVKRPRDRQAAATAAAHEHNMREMVLMLGRLKSLPAVQEMLLARMRQARVEQAEDKAGAMIQWWLSPVCPACHGTKFQVLAGTTIQTGKPCRSCGGSGLAKVPHGEEGRRLANWMDECTKYAQHSIRNRLRTMRPRA